MITVITCTGHRIEAFKLCVEYIKRQTIRERFQWIVVNDDLKSAELKPLLTSLPKYISAELYQGPETWKPGVNTHKKNMEQALLNIKGDRVLFMEDDDWYAINYIEKMNKLLDYGDIVGEGNASYYNIKLPGWKRMQNYNQASLCQTGIKATLLEQLKVAIRGGGNIDGNLWEICHHQGVPTVLVVDNNLCIGMKGLPGRVGIGVGHQYKGYLPDPNLAILRKWTGADSAKYINFMREQIINGKETKTSGINDKNGIQKVEQKGQPQSQKAPQGSR